MQPFIIDSHCHLNYPEFTQDLPAVIANAAAAGVGVMQTICTKMEEFEDVHAIATAHDAIYCSVGVHPHHADKAPLVSVESLLEKAALSKVIGIGETGLDYYYDYSDREAQRRSFQHHIIAAQESGLPLIVHTRDAEEDTLEMLHTAMKEHPYPLLIHCFTASEAFGQAVIEMGGYISLSGILTFKKAEALQEAARNLPLERLLIETDAPYLAPVPHRGQRNQPAYTSHVCAQLASLKGITVEECAAATTANFFGLFKKAHRNQA
jgi:TatD DNase family protein